jgi:drug/metabolite transporter (DMT)-like permease
MPRTILLLLAGNLAVSAAVIFIKASAIHPLYQAAWRVLGAALVLTPFYFRDLKRFGLTLSWKLVRPSIVPGIVLAVHFASWLVSVKMTLAANASIIVNMMPVAMPFIAWVLHRERINAREVLGTALTVAGLAILGWNDFHLNPATFAGDLLSFVSMLFYALYLALAKRHNTLPSNQLYVVPLYYTAGLLCMLFALPFASPLAQPFDAANLGLLAALILLPTVIGHSIFNYAMRFARSQLVSLFMFTQVIFAVLLAVFILGEIPSPAFYPAAALMTAGMILSVVP